MGQVEGNGNGGNAVRREPLVAKVAAGTEGDSTRGELGIELTDSGLELALFDADAEVADAELEELLVFERGPRRLCGYLHWFYPTVRNAPDKQPSEVGCGRRCLPTLLK